MLVSVGQGYACKVHCLGDKFDLAIFRILEHDSVVNLGEQLHVGKHLPHAPQGAVQEVSDDGLRHIRNCFSKSGIIIWAAEKVSAASQGGS